MEKPNSKNSPDPQAADLETGRDELNLAEFPLTALTHRVPPGCKTLVFEDRIRDQSTGEMVTRRLTISAAEEYGLPTTIDDDVIVALIQLTKRTNGFSDRTVPFSRYALIEILGWPDSGQSYARVEESLSRWLGVTLRYEKAWWDKEEKAWVDEHFHIIDNVTLYDQEARARRRKRGENEPLLSSFSWNKVVFRSFRAENLKRLDLKLYFTLTHAPAKRAYRFLDKRFYRRSRLEFDLREFACEHVGLSRKYDIGKMKEKLDPSIRELEEKNFIEPLSREERYVQVRRGNWRVIFIKKTPEGPRPTKARLHALERELVKRGVTAATATELVAAHPPERISVKLEVFDWLSTNGDGRVSRNPAGYLVTSVRDDYSAPQGFETTRERDARKEAGAARRQEAEDAMQRRKARVDAKREAEEAPVARYWNSLSRVEQDAVQEKAVAEADPWLLSQYERCLETKPEFAIHFLQPIIDKYLVKVLPPEFSPAP